MFKKGNTLACRLAVLLSILIGLNGHSQPAPTAGELEVSHTWAQAKFCGVPAPKTDTAGLTVLANHDPVQRNTRGGKPLRLGNRQFERGLYCHASSQIMVRLPMPGGTFQSVVGVDSNEQTSGGRGSVVFSVHAQGRELFRSPILREGMAPLPVKVDLQSVTQFVLQVEDAGDGISCDQADWADAGVEVKGGQILWLGEMPLVSAPRQAPSMEPPFSFQYGGRSSRELLPRWQLTRTLRGLDARRRSLQLDYLDRESGLALRCEAVEYLDFACVEWVLQLTNRGTSPTPIISDLQVIDVEFDRGAGGEFTLHHHAGSPCTATDYEPFATHLEPKAEKRITTSGGRSSNSDWPYFNVEAPGEGLLMAIGWPGQWSARFQRDDANHLRLKAGQELTHFKLLPGESVRSPMVALMFYQGDWIRSQNLWRRWMLAWNVPKPGGKLPPAQMAACSSHQFGEMIHADEASQILFVDRYLLEQIKLDYWWMDAGWYINQGGWPNTGTWEVDRRRFPRGLRYITDHAHARNVKSIVWFEPERVNPGTWLYLQRPQWLLGKTGSDQLLDLGNPEARQWLTEHVDHLINEEGIDLYRNDFNIDPLPFWRANDAPDRQGITEIRYVTGFLAYWDELLRRHPGMLIDTCASGGRRNDLETLRRSVPLLRSDYILEPVGQQLHTYGLAMWVPFFGTGINSTDPYVFRSQMCPHLTGCWDVRNRQLDYPRLRELYGQWRKVADYFFGDFYPLTPYAIDNQCWMAWQFDVPEKGEGMIQAFRRGESPFESARFKLRGLRSTSRYRFSRVDETGNQVYSGEDLMQQGVVIPITAQPGAEIYIYKEVRN